MAVLVVLCGCKAQKSVKIRTEHLSFSCNVSYANEKYCFDVKTTKNGVYDCALTAPDDLKGMAFTLSGEKVTVKYSGMEIEKNLNDIPYGNMIGLFYDVMKKSNGKTAAEKDKNYCLSGKIKNSEYRLYVSPSGLPMSLEFPNEKIYMEFNNLTLVKGE